MNRFLWQNAILCTLLLVLGSSSSDAAESRFIVVLNLRLESGASLSDSEIVYYTELMRKGVQDNVSAYSLMDRQSMDAILQGFDTEACDAEDGTCEVDIARKLNAAVAVSGSLFRLGDEYRVVLTVHETKNARRLNTVKVKAVSKSDLEATIENAMTELLEPISKQRVRAAAVGVPDGPQIVSSTWEEGAWTGPKTGKSAVTEALAYLTLRASPEDAVISVTYPGGRAFSEVGSFIRTDLRPGDYSIKVELAGYETVVRTMRLEPDDNKADKIVLVRRGALELAGQPEMARVDISGPGGFQETRGLPLTISNLEKGQYQIRVSKAGFEPESYSVEVIPGKLAALNINLKRPGSLRIIGAPTGSKIDVVGPNGLVESGGLPMTIEETYRGKYHITVSRNGYNDYVTDAVVEPGRVTEVNVTLRKKGELGGVWYSNFRCSNCDCSNYLVVDLNAGVAREYSGWCQSNETNAVLQQGTARLEAGTLTVSHTSVKGLSGRPAYNPDTRILSISGDRLQGTSNDAGTSKRPTTYERVVDGSTGGQIAGTKWKCHMYERLPCTFTVDTSMTQAELFTNDGNCSATMRGAVTKSGDRYSFKGKVVSSRGCSGYNPDDFDFRLVNGGFFMEGKAGDGRVSGAFTAVRIK